MNQSGIVTDTDTRRAQEREASRLVSMRAWSDVNRERRKEATAEHHAPAVRRSRCSRRPLSAVFGAEGEKYSMVRAVRFLVDDTGRKTAVQIDLKRQARLWEDFYDRALAEQRASEPREPLEAVKRRCPPAPAWLNTKLSSWVDASSGVLPDPAARI
jgi:hypothetical protein